MFCKTVRLKVFCSNTPCQLTILSGNNSVIKTCTVSLCHSEICLRTAGGMLKIIARYQNQTICRIIYLRCCWCQTVCTCFNFNAPSLVNITLTDANYGFPVSNAILNFQSQV